MVNSPKAPLPVEFPVIVTWVRLVVAPLSSLKIPPPLPPSPPLWGRKVVAPLPL